MSYLNDTYMSEIQFSGYVDAVCPVNNSSYDAYITVTVEDPEYIPEYSSVAKFIKSYKQIQCRPDCLTANLFDWIVEQVKNCSHIKVTCNTWDDNSPENIFIREQDFKQKKVM